MFTDGNPSESDSFIDDLEKLTLEITKKQPLTFKSCTENNGADHWIKEIDEVDGLKDDEEPAFPFTKGLWFYPSLDQCYINPIDLDALDEARPFKQESLDSLLDRKTTHEEYQRYFDNHPCSKEYQNQYHAFCREDIQKDEEEKKSEHRSCKKF